MDKVNQYVKMMKELADIRHKHKFNNSQEEDNYTKNMDALWSTMSKHEQELSWNLHKATPLMSEQETKPLTIKTAQYNHRDGTATVSTYNFEDGTVTED